MATSDGRARFLGQRAGHGDDLHNRIRNDHYGIWLGVAGHVTATISDNVFQNVTTDVLTSP